jgi:hypothetical protein
LVVTLFLSRVLSIADQEHAIRSIPIAPFNANNLSLPHCGRNSEANDTINRDLLALVRLKSGDDPTKLVLRRTSVSFIALSNKTEAGESNASEIQWFDGYRNSVNSCGVGQNCLDIPQVHADRYGSSALGRTLFAKLYESFAIKLAVAKLAKSSIKKGQAGILRPPDLLADFLKILSMYRDKIAKELGVSGSCRGWLLTIDSSFDI